MTMTDFDILAASFLDRLDTQGRRRALRQATKTSAAPLLMEGRRVLNFSSNDYLGLSNHPLLIERACAYAKDFGTGSGASRLVCGNLDAFAAIEAKLAQGKGTEAALVMASGFQANASILPALLDREFLGGDAVVFTDRLNHASLHHGLAAAGQRQIRFRHNDLDHLEQLLKAHEHHKAARFIITESVFSMDGDCADIAALSALAQRHGAFLYVDEAHATGVLGRDGFGLCAGHKVDLVMGTFSKALGSFGAYVACSKALRDYLVNRCAGLIYATALPPPVLGAMDAALDLLPQLDDRRRKVLGHGEKLRAALHDGGLAFGRSTTQIVPVIFGSEERTLKVSRALEEDGLLGIAIRPPTVPQGASRLRLALSASHDDADIDRLIAALIGHGA